MNGPVLTTQRLVLTPFALAAYKDPDSELETPHTLCMISPENTASIALALKHGFSSRASTEYHGSAVGFTVACVVARQTGTGGLTQA